MEFYIIREGNHHADESGISLTFKKKLNFVARFNETLYNLGKQEDISKLYGFSDCWSHHHKNSARIGWRWDIEQKRVDLFAYVYTDGNRSFQYITSIKVNELFECKIEIERNLYRFTVLGFIDNRHWEESVSIIRRSSSTFSLRYRLFPYFGGDQVAPKSISIEVSEL